MTVDLAALAAPFPADAIHWRAQSLTSDGDKAMALAYIDARDVMDRLDAVCGSANWQDSYTETVKGRLICALQIRIDGEWITKSDGAGDTDVEGEKGAISDSLKRAGVKWGIGRYLYNLGNVWAPCEASEFNGKKKWKAWKPEADRVFAAALAKIAPPEPVIDDGQWALITSLIASTSTNSVALCEHYGIPSLKQMTVGQFKDAKARLEKRLPKPETEQKEVA
ncbi:MAG: hypothetical protein J7500_15575 [Sphingomonas sp.]|uniref:Rad52/Rad22 family DNA repair protein n=1 Tax=Sphingomonas sp. TaxID=28214 RepID=UPI001B210147|nr:Rad52/Rad22 family DNA repair protein [Sphingomonas sp.]MBO9624127.1 hypothetical protein [Sphingomonas sp.]